MNKKTLIFVVAGIFAVIAVITAILYSNKSTPTTNTNNANVVTNAPVVNISTNTDTQEPTNSATNELQEQAATQRAASIFTEQYGTYTGGFNTKVLENLKPLVTDTFEAALLKTASAPTNDDNAIVLTTQVLNTKLTSFSSGTSAKVTVSTFREQSSSTGDSPTQLSQDINVSLVYQSGQWLVSSAEWGTPKNIDSL